MAFPPTPFLAMLDRHKAGPLGNAWNRRLRPEHQHPKIPATFVDAMKVRTAVYVDELGAPQVHEFHFDDWHAFHWVMYISERRVIEPELRDFITGQLLRPRKTETKSIPLGTIRMVPFPHPALPRTGGVYVGGRLTNAGSSAGVVARPAFDGVEVAALTDEEAAREKDPDVWPPAVDAATEHFDGKEAYIKIGRLAVRREQRSTPRYAGQLIDAVVEFMRRNCLAFNPRGSNIGFAKIGPHSARLIPEWKGLFCCLAQETDVALWERHHFKLDKAMGRWLEDGVPHVAMFRRIELPPDRLANVTMNVFFRDAKRL